MRYFSVLLLVFMCGRNCFDVIDQCHLSSFGLTDKEDKIAKHFDDLIRRGIPIAYECLEFLMLRGFYKTSVDIYEQYFILNQIDVSPQLQALVDKDGSLQNNRELSYIFKHSISKSSKVQTVQPVINWAQSRNQTLINIKFSLRIDAPACLNIKIEHIKIYDDKVVLSAFGIVSHSPIRYETTINLYKPINTTLSIYKHEAVGTMFFNLTKIEQNVLWIRLTVEDIKTPIWWDLRDQLKQDMDDFAKMLEEDDDKREKNSDKKNRKKQKLNQKEKEKQERNDLNEKLRSYQMERNQCFFNSGRCENGWYQRQ